MYWTLTLSKVNVTRIKAVIGFWEWRVCLYFFICADFKKVLMEPSLRSRSQFHCRGWHNFGGLFDAATSNI